MRSSCLTYCALHVLLTLILTYTVIMLWARSLSSFHLIPPLMDRLRSDWHAGQKKLAAFWHFQCNLAKSICLELAYPLMAWQFVPILIGSVEGVHACQCSCLCCRSLCLALSGMVLFVEMDVETAQVTGSGIDMIQTDFSTRASSLRIQRSRH